MEMEWSTILFRFCAMLCSCSGSVTQVYPIELCRRPARCKDQAFAGSCPQRSIASLSKHFLAKF